MISERPANQRVVITGMGVITPCGDTVASFWDSLVNGRSGITRWAEDRSSNIYSKIGGDMSAYDVEEHFGRVASRYPEATMATARRLLRPTPMSGRLTAAASLQAWFDAGLFATDAIAPERVGQVFAGTNVNMRYAMANILVYQQEPEFIDPLFAVVGPDPDVLTLVSALLNIKGPTYTVGNACATGNIAIMNAVDLLRAGRSTAVLVSASSSEVDPLMLQGFAFISALSYESFNDEPQRASRPFDKLREGFVPSEGAAALVLETLESALARGAKIYAELLGVSSASDASRSTSPSTDGQVRSISLALADGRVGISDIDYVNAHATSTPVGDATEVESLRAAFGKRIYDIPVNATKSITGHFLNAAGVAEMIAIVLQMQQRTLHPTINQECPDPEFDLDFVPNAARPYNINVAISNSFGFGGLNSCIVVQRWDG